MQSTDYLMSNKTERMGNDFAACSHSYKSSPIYIARTFMNGVEGKYTKLILA